MLSKPILVEMTRFELATSTSRTWRSTKLSHISLMIFSLFSVSGQTCGQTTYIGVVIELIIAQKCSVFKGFRRFCKFYARNRQFAPEPSALPNCATPRKLIIRCAHYLLQLRLRLRDLLACLHQVAATRLFSLHPPPAALETLPNCATPRKLIIRCAHYLLQLRLRLRDLLACLHQVAATRLFSLHPPPAALETLPNCATPRK